MATFHTRGTGCRLHSDARSAAAAALGDGRRALNLLFTEHPPFDKSEARIAQALADVATIGVLQQRGAFRAAQVTEQLQFALNSRVVIEQAKGMIAQHATLGMDDAFELLRKHARDHNLKLTELATRLAAGEYSIAAIAGD